MMSSRSRPARTRKAPSERKSEIVDTAARIALDHGMEKITLRAVAERMGVRPGLISHYFASVDDLLVAAYEQAITTEREGLFTPAGDPLDRLVRMITRVDLPDSVELTRLWLNVRNMCRHHAPLAEAMERQEALMREHMQDLLDEGVAAGAFRTEDTRGAGIRIFVAIDGIGAYVNHPDPFPEEAYIWFVADIAADSLGLPRERLREAITRSRREKA